MSGWTGNWNYPTSIQFGPGRIAAAVGTATLSLFGPTDPTLWAPRRETSRVLVAPMRDLNQLSVERVVEETMQTLALTP